MAEGWLKDCEICNVGLCAEVDSLKEMGHSENAACERLVLHQELKLGKVIYTKDALRVRYRYYKNLDKKLEENLQPNPEIIGKTKPASKMTVEVEYEVISTTLEKQGGKITNVEFNRAYKELRRVLKQLRLEGFGRMGAPSHLVKGKVMDLVFLIK